MLPVKVVKEDGTETADNELGAIVVKEPLPPGSFSTLWKDDERFKNLYFSKYEVGLAKYIQLLLELYLYNFYIIRHVCDEVIQQCYLPSRMVVHSRQQASLIVNCV